VRRSIDAGWTSLTSGSERDADDGSGGAGSSELAGDELLARDELRAAYDDATRRAADWYSSRLGLDGDEMRRGRHGRTRPLSTSAVPAPRDDRTRGTARADR
jgi:hypothetical protein